MLPTSEPGFEPHRGPFFLSGTTYSTPTTFHTNRQIGTNRGEKFGLTKTIDTSERRRCWFQGREPCDENDGRPKSPTARAEPTALLEFCFGT